MLGEAREDVEAEVEEEHVANWMIPVTFGNNWWYADLPINQQAQLNLCSHGSCCGPELCSTCNFFSGHLVSTMFYIMQILRFYMVRQKYYETCVVHFTFQKTDLQEGTTLLSWMFNHVPWDVISFQRHVKRLFNSGLLLSFVIPTCTFYSNIQAADELLCDIYYFHVTSATINSFKLWQ